MEILFSEEMKEALPAIIALYFTETKSDLVLRIEEFDVGRIPVDLFSCQCPDIGDEKFFRLVFFHIFEFQVGKFLQKSKSIRVSKF